MKAKKRVQHFLLDFITGESTAIGTKVKIKNILNSIQTLIITRTIASIITISTVMITVFFPLYSGRIESVVKLLNGTGSTFTVSDGWNIAMVITFFFMSIIFGIIGVMVYQYKLVADSITRNEYELSVAKEYYLSSNRYSIDKMYSDALKQACKEIVGLFSFVHSATIYRYSIKTDNKVAHINLKPYRTHSILNTRTTLIFENYYVDKKFYDRFMELRHKVSMYTKNTIPEFLMVEAVKLMNDLNKLLIKSTPTENDQNNSLETMQNIAPELFNNDEIDDTICTCYAIVCAITALFDGVIEFKSLYDNYVETISYHMRTGILTAILLDSEYYQTNFKKNSKNGRIYLWSPLQIFNRSCILALNINESDMHNDYVKLFTNTEIREHNLYKNEVVHWNFIRDRLREKVMETFDSIMIKLLGISNNGGM